MLEGRADDGTETVLCHVAGDRQAAERLLTAEVHPREFDITPESGDGFFLYLRRDLDVAVPRVRPYASALGDGLSGRHREALETARAVGYYEVPRDGGLKAVADELDCAVSTASALLRRSEAHLVDDALGRRG